MIATQIDLHPDAVQHFNIIDLVLLKYNTKDNYALEQVHWP